MPWPAEQTGLPESPPEEGWEENMCVKLSEVIGDFAMRGWGILAVALVRICNGLWDCQIGQLFKQVKTC